LAFSRAGELETRRAAPIGRRTAKTAAPPLRIFVRIPARQIMNVWRQ
jgi:hypothetical protein